MGDLLGSSCVAPIFLQMGPSTLCATGTMVHWFIHKCESWCRDILLDIRTRRRYEVCMHKETNEGRGEGMRRSVCIYNAE